MVIVNGLRVCPGVHASTRNVGAIFHVQGLDVSGVGASRAPKPGLIRNVLRRGKAIVLYHLLAAEGAAVARPNPARIVLRRPHIEWAALANSLVVAGKRVGARNYLRQICIFVIAPEPVIVGPRPCARPPLKCTKSLAIRRVVSGSKHAYVIDRHDGSALPAISHQTRPLQVSKPPRRLADVPPVRFSRIVHLPFAYLKS